MGERDGPWRKWGDDGVTNVGSVGEAGGRRGTSGEAGGSRGQSPRELGLILAICTLYSQGVIKKLNGLARKVDGLT